MAKQKQTNKNDNTIINNKEKKEMFGFTSLGKHFEEPLFAISATTAFFTLVYLFTRNFSGVVSMSDISFMITVIVILVGLLSIYFIYLYFKSEKKNYMFLGTPILIFLTALFLWSANGASGFSARDYSVFSLILGLFVFFYALSLHNIIKLRTAVISVIFIGGLVVHLAPAYTMPGANFSGKYLAALDPYYYYRHAKFLFNTGFLPERETLNYPTDPPSQAKGSFMVSMLMGSLALVLNPLGITVHDVAMIYPGVFAVFTMLVLYLLIRDLFTENKPYNHLAGLFASFMLIFSRAFASKAIATNSEDDALGMFLLVSSFLLAILAFRRKSIPISILAGFSFLMLNLSWNGYSFAILVYGIFAFLYSFMNFFHKKNCIEHIPYYIIPVFISQLHPIILHSQGLMPTFTMPPPLILLPLIATLFTSFLLEFVRIRFYGKETSEGLKFENKFLNYIEKNISIIFVIVLILGVLFLTSPVLFPTLKFGMTPENAISYMVNMVKGAKVQSIIGKTTAEQHSLCSSINGDCFREFINTFGLGALFGLIMLFILPYFIYKRRSLGAIFVIAWALPMVWGVINKAQYQFTASVPIIALGSTIGLLLVLKRKDLQGLRVIPTLIFIVIIIMLPFLQKNMILFGPFGGPIPMYMGASQDRIFWNPTLQWFKKNTPANSTVILTWWDYGHWIAAVSERSSILDNVKARALMVQDVAKFHVLIENESKALDLAKKYGATYVVIDWAMIGKSAAPHFIATSNVTAPVDDPNREGESEGYGQCGFSSKNSILKPQLLPNKKGGFDSVKTIVFTCGIGGPPERYIGSVIFDIKNDMLSDVKVNPIIRTKRGLSLDAPISWSLWKKENGGSILGVQSLKAILGNVLNYGTNKFVNFPTYTSLIFVPEKFNNYMMTKLYLGDYIAEYKQFGLTDIEPLKHFKLVDGFLGDKMDNSYLGYVRVYKIIYNLNLTDENNTVEAKSGSVGNKAGSIEVTGNT